MYFAKLFATLRETVGMMFVRKFGNKPPKQMSENEIAKLVLNSAYQLYRNIGPGFLESAYENALAYDLQLLNLNVKQQSPMPFIYKEVKMEVGYRIDLLVENKFIIEIKSVETLAPVHFAQTLTYLKLSGIKLGMLINFGASSFKENVHRIVNGL